MSTLKSVANSQLPESTRKEPTAATPARRQVLVHMGRASKETQGVARGLEFLIYPRYA